MAAITKYKKCINQSHTLLTTVSLSWLLNNSTVRKVKRFQRVIISCKSKKDRQYKKKKEIRTNNERKKHCIKK